MQRIFTAGPWEKGSAVPGLRPYGLGQEGDYDCSTGVCIPRAKLPIAFQVSQAYDAAIKVNPDCVSKVNVNPVGGITAENGPEIIRQLDACVKAPPVDEGESDLQKLVRLTYEAYDTNRPCWEKYNVLPASVSDAEAITILEECMRPTVRPTPITNAAAPPASPSTAPVTNEFPVAPLLIGAGALILLLSL